MGNAIVRAHTDESQPFIVCYEYDAMLYAAASAGSSVVSTSVLGFGAKAALSWDVLVEHERRHAQVASISLSGSPTLCATGEILPALKYLNDVRGGVPTIQLTTDFILMDGAPAISDAQREYRSVDVLPRLLAVAS